ncbi:MULTISPECIES: FABP family protein [Corynebacterium]|uniref:FABP family protein n=1 Tax=Corynebacterium TaxID=1716 RepID=UPI00124C77C3|nr:MULTISPECIES: FABP family protein [Corynebacterium]MBV7282669.1 FABP family protein [Corynebacterium sp. TAE3-ERU30]MBV7301983.1 FABP family protein [Corynebacterium sp. TAE3-ERU2]
MTDSSTNHPENLSPRLDGNEAVNRAAEVAKTTGGRNIPSLGELPIPADTANLREGPSLHDGLLALLPLVGVWRGEGQADTPEDGEFTFGNQLIFSHDGGNYINVESKCWKKDAPESLESRETGFLRINDKDEIEFILCHSGGAVEIMYGEPLNERAWELSSASTMATASGLTTLGPGKRLYGLLPNGDLGWVDERLVDQELKPRRSAQLQRYAG